MSLIIGKKQYVVIFMTADSIHIHMYNEHDSIVPLMTLSKMSSKLINVGRVFN